jgi:hypothetical protein
MHHVYYSMVLPSALINDMHYLYIYKKKLPKVATFCDRRTINFFCFIFLGRLETSA